MIEHYNDHNRVLIQFAPVLRKIFHFLRVKLPNTWFWFFLNISLQKIVVPYVMFQIICDDFYLYGKTFKYLFWFSWYRLHTPTFTKKKLFWSSAPKVWHKYSLIAQESNVRKLIAIHVYIYALLLEIDN